MLVALILPIIYGILMMNDPFGLENIRSFLKGVNKFYSQFDRRPASDKIIWQEGSTRVLNYTSNPQSELPCLFFIPSLINKSYILDLDEESSLVNHFAKLGYKVYLLDFTEPQSDELLMKFNDYRERIIKAISNTCKSKAIITIGYCLGGIFSCSINSEKNLNIIGQILIATPVDLSHLNNPLIFNNFALMAETLDKIPPSMVQLFFSYLAPSRIWDKFCQFSTMQEEQEIDKFLSIEQWVNDGISLSKSFALEAASMITDNSLLKENFLTYCDIPSLIINGSEDSIAPINSSMPLYTSILNKEILVEKTGHIGLIISKTAKERIWPKMEKWILELFHRTS